MRTSPRSRSLRARSARVLALGLSAAVAASLVSLTALPADASAPAARSYSAGIYLVALNPDAADSPTAVADAVGAKPLASYEAALHGFAAKLSAAQATALAADPAVALITPDEAVASTVPSGTPLSGAPAKAKAKSPASTTSAKASRLGGEVVFKGAHPSSVDTGAEYGVWGPLGGPTQAGAGVVVGVVGSGVSPEATGLEGAPLGTDDGAAPFLDGHTIVFHKADGTDFHGGCQADGDPSNPSWNAGDCTTKIVSARYFKRGYDTRTDQSVAAFPTEYLSPRDAVGTGTTAASVAVGNAHAPVPAVPGMTISGMAPAAKLASYKVCWNGTGNSNECNLADIISAVNQAVVDGVDILDMAVDPLDSSGLSLIDLALYGAAKAGITVVAPAGDTGQGTSVNSVYNAPFYLTVAAGTADNQALAPNRRTSAHPANAPIKPDLVAPGVDTLAAQQSIYIGTGFMAAVNQTTSSYNASAYAAGAAALYQAAHPQAGVREIKSALMTTAVPLRDPDTEVPLSPFEQGAGAMNPFTFTSAAISFDAEYPTDWERYLQWSGLETGASVPSTENWMSNEHAWDVNESSIVVDGTDMVTRIRRSIVPLRVGDFTVRVDGLDGVQVTPEYDSFSVTPDQIGRSRTIDFIFDPINLTHLGEWLFGTISISGGESGGYALMPVAFRAVPSTVTAAGEGTGTAGSVSLPVSVGATGTPSVTASGLAELQHLSSDGSSSDPERSGGHVDDGYAGSDRHHWTVDIPVGTRVAYFGERTYPGDGVVGDPVGAKDPVDPVPTVDLQASLIRRADGGDDLGGFLFPPVGERAGISKAIVVKDPVPGSYDVTVVASGQSLDFDVWSGALGDGGAGDFAATINRTPGTRQGQPALATASWHGLAPHRHYLGAIAYSDSDALSIVTVDSGDGKALSNTAAPSIGGIAQPGSTLTALPGGWSVDGLDYAYQWKRDGVAIDGATDASYPVTLADLGTALSVAVTATKPEYTPATSNSAAVDVHEVPVSNTVAPSLSGTAKVGQKLTATPGSWSATGLAFAYRWSVDGTPIPGATLSTLTVPNQAAGRSVSVTVTATRPGYATVSAASAALSIAGLPVRNLVAPKVSGTPAIGRTLHASAGSWSVAGLTASYRWLAGGKPISGASSPALKVTSALAGKKLAVQVTVSGPRYQGASATSTAVLVKYDAKLKIALKASKAKGVRSLTVAVTVSSKGKPTGKVVVKAAGHRHTLTLKGGKAVLKLSRLAKGTVSVTASYAGSASVGAATGSAKVVLR